MMQNGRLYPGPKVVKVKPMFPQLSATALDVHAERAVWAMGEGRHFCYNGKIQIAKGRKPWRTRAREAEPASTRS